MSSVDGLEILKNWQSAETALVSSAVNLSGRVPLVELRVKVFSVDESTVVFLDMDSSDRETLDLRGATFSSRGRDIGLLIKFADGKQTLLREAR